MSISSEELKMLRQTLSQNQEIIFLYEEKLKQLQTTNKGINREKRALENTVRVLQSGHDGSGEVGALSNSLTTLIAERKRCEAEFKENKKKILLELRESRDEADELRRDLSLKDTEMGRQMDELKSKLIVEQHEREKEQKSHNSTLKELQKRLFEERNEKTRLLKNDKEPSVKEVEGEAKGSLTLGIERASPLLNKKGSKTVSADEINRLRKEMHEMEFHHRQQLEKAETRAVEAEKRSLEMQETQESRVLNLERRLEELSDSVATYDHQRHEDQISIAKLRERIAQLDTENVALTHVRHTVEEDSFEMDEEEDLHSILKKIIRLRSELRERNAKSDDPISDIDSFFTDDEKKDVFSSSNSRDEDWKAKYFTLEEELLALKKKIPGQYQDPQNFKQLSKDLKTAQEDNASLKMNLNDLKDKVSRLRHQLSSSEEEKSYLEKQIRDLNMEFNGIKLSLSDALQSKDSEMRNNSLKLESELEKQRERFLSSMKEKEEELKNMRDNLEIAIDNGFVSYMNRKSTSGSNNMDNLTDKLCPSNDDETRMIIHYSEETARKDKEMSQLRDEIRDLESGMRDIQARFINKEEEYVSEVERLQDKVEILQRMSKSDFNVEYLKNVVVNYMLSSDIPSKEHMLNAIAAVLVFSDKETRKIKAFHNSWFWKKSS